MALPYYAFGQAHEEDNELGDYHSEERHDEGAPTLSQSGRRPKTTEGTIRLGFKGEFFLSLQYMARITP